MEEYRIQSVSNEEGVVSPTERLRYRVELFLVEAGLSIALIRSQDRFGVVFGRTGFTTSPLGNGSVRVGVGIHGAEAEEQTTALLESITAVLSEAGFSLGLVENGWALEVSE